MSASMTAAMDTLRQRLADLPRWLETRDLLSRSECELIATDSFAFVVFDDDDEFGSVVGKPDISAIQKAAQECDEILAFPDNIDHVVAALPKWKAEQVSVHLAMIDYQRKRKLQAVWCAVQSNTGSLKLAEKLGFKVVDKIWLLTIDN